MNQTNDNASLEMPENTNPRVALITGASQRLGAATSKELHQHGYNIIIHYNQSLTSAQELVNSFNQKRENSAHAIQADLNDAKSVTNLAESALGLHGKINVLVNNASSFYPTPMGSGTDKDWENLFGSNSKAPFFLSQHLTETLKANQGCIINMVDIHAARPIKDHTIYCMAKSSLVTLTKSLAKELAPQVRVNGVAPGAILWPENITEAEKEKILRQIPLERIGSAKDIAKTILFLVQADYITGQIIAVDGGRSL